MSGADEQIAIDVDDSAIDAVIAKLDEVLRKTSEDVGENHSPSNSADSWGTRSVSLC